MFYKNIYVICIKIIFILICNKQISTE